MTKGKIPENHLDSDKVYVRLRFDLSGIYPDKVQDQNLILLITLYLYFL